MSGFYAVNNNEFYREGCCNVSIHGGDVYRNHVDLDFSVNVNPLGVPRAVKAALSSAVELCSRYPDPEAERLRRAVSDMLQVSEEKLLFGNGASELFMAVVHAVRPKKVVIPVPSFYGYEYAAKAADCEIVYYETRRENAFGITEEICEVLTGDVDLLFLANPNNPTGTFSRRENIKRLLDHCSDRGIYVVMDECFIAFCGGQFSALSEIRSEGSGNLILISAFTKIFSIPGVRLGYLVCGNRPLLEKIRKQLPEWNLSCFAQEAGCVCAKQTDFIVETQHFVNRERPFLTEGLRRRGYVVFPSMANFVLVYCREAAREKGLCGIPLYESLLKKGILIRDCSNFRGLGSGFYRIAVRTRTENELLLRSCPQIMEER